MKYFCEKCNMLSPDTECRRCVRKICAKLPTMIFVTSLHSIRSVTIYLKQISKNKNIPIATLGSGIAFARRTSAELHVFIPYGCFDRAHEIYDVIFGTEE